MSLPQMELAFIFTRTWREPGLGTGNCLNSTVLLPGKTTPVMVAGAVVINFSISRRRNRAVDIPERFPGLPLFPEEDLALDQPAVLVDFGDVLHVLRGQRLGYG